MQTNWRMTREIIRQRIEAVSADIRRKHQERRVRQKEYHKNYHKSLSELPKASPVANRMARAAAGASPDPPAGPKSIKSTSQGKVNVNLQVGEF